MQWWCDHVRVYGGTLNDNPSAGNIAGGITTILEKSLGAVAKAGVSPLSAVYEYAQPIDAHGLVFMDSPGFDPMSVTGQVASGANLIAFTTGRGSTFGCKPVPSLKLATNTPMYRRMRDDMDINCGDIVDGATQHRGEGPRDLRGAGRAGQRRAQRQRATGIRRGGIRAVGSGGADLNV